MKRIRLRMVMWFARGMGVPVDVHPSFFAFGRNSAKTLSWAIAPK